MDNAERRSLRLSVRSESIKESFSQCRSFYLVINKPHSKSRNVLMKCADYLKMAGTVNME